MGEISCEIIAFAIADRGSSVRKLASVGVEGDGTLGIIIFESFGFGEAEAEFGGRVVGEMFLHVLVGNQGDVAHIVNFIMKVDK